MDQRRDPRTIAGELVHPSTQGPLASNTGKPVKTTLIRITAATVLLGAAGYAMAPRATGYVSSSAVVNAPLVALIAPFNGVIRADSGEVADPVATGETLFVLHNARSQRSHLQTLDADLAALEGEISGVKKQILDLQVHSDSIDQRRQARIAARTAWFEIRMREAEAAIAGSRVNIDRFKKDRERTAYLTKIGGMPEKDLVRAEFDVAAAETDLARDLAFFDRVKFERDTLSGVSGADLSTGGADQMNDRLDDIALRITDSEARLQALGARRAGLLTQIALGDSEALAQEIFAPVNTADGVIWVSSAAAGANVAVGQQIASVLDCSRRFLEVELPERHFEDIAAGSLARVQMKGSRETFFGEVVAIYGSGARTNGDTHAASPRISTTAGLRAIVNLPDVDVNDIVVSSSFCDVGRTAEVRFEMADDGILARLSGAIGYLSGLLEKDQHPDDARLQITSWNRAS